MYKVRRTLSSVSDPVGNPGPYNPGMAPAGILAAALLAAPPPQDRSPDRDLEGPAARCGSEIPWAPSLEEAQRRSRQTGRPIAWWIPTLEGSPMDRKKVVEKYLLAGPLMMPDVVERMSRDFIPLRMAGDRSHRRPFGLEPLEFIEPGILFLTADLEVLHRVDRISTFSEEWFRHLLDGVLRKAGRPPPEGRDRSEGPRRLLALPRPDPALFESLEGPEARYCQGVALHLAGRDDEGRTVWRAIPEGRWAWKAAAELSRDGPFVRGFEIYEALPPGAPEGLPSSTTRPQKDADPERALRFLLGMQRHHGGWDDCNYNFGGDDSLPNVYMAVTALAALALREWGEPARVGKALERAEAYLRDESRIAEEDSDEIVWAHAYRLLYFARAGDRPSAARMVRALAVRQDRRGAWGHEYPNPFVTATVLLALDEARRAGVEVPEALLRRGGEALASARDRRGVFSYGFPGRGGDVRGAAGRMPLCELALLRCGRSTTEDVAAAVEESFRHHALLERVRKYDDHADAWRNGGFFFWYDQWGRAMAAAAAGAEEARRRQRRIVLETSEIDGCWVDSHELGRVYGTAVALLTLKACGP